MPIRKLPKLVVILGPTASGKTALSLKLAKKFNGEIISADSRAIYKELDIGSAKPRRDFNRVLYLHDRSDITLFNVYISGGISHHLIDVVAPDQTLTLAKYKELATKAIYNIARRKMVPFLVGGTALYIYSLIDNWLIPEAPPNEKLRARLEKQSVGKLYARLIKKDPAAQQFIDSKNKRRIIRALEIIATTKKPFSEQRRRGPQLFDTLMLGVKKSPSEIKKNIAKRTKQMLQDGLVAEVKKLLKKGYSPESPALSGIHYKEIISHLKKETTLPKAIAQINKNDEQLVHRQMMWFKKDHRIKWTINEQGAEKEVKKFIKT